MKTQEVLTIGLASVLISSFVAGVTVYRFLQTMIEDRVSAVERKTDAVKSASEDRANAIERKADTAIVAATRANGRLDGIRIGSAPTQESARTFGCGGSDVASANDEVMVGLRDGTGCGVPNQNFYKKIVVEVPR